MDHETRELLGNIIGLLEVIKKDIKVIKQDIYVMNSRREEPNHLNQALDEIRQPVKPLDEKNSLSSTLRDQLKMSRLR